jgi:hypothetical protein
MPSIASVQLVSKTGKVFMPLTDDSFLPGKVPAFYPTWVLLTDINPDPFPCCLTQDFTGASSGSATFPWASTIGPANSGTVSVSVTSFSDNGDGTWDCVVIVSAVVTSGSGTITTIEISTNWGGNYNSGDHMPVPYLDTIFDHIFVAGTDPMGDFSGTGIPGEFTAPGFLYWTNPYFFINDVIYHDLLRWDPVVNGNECYCTQPATLTGEVDYVFFKYIIGVSGLAPGSSYTIYLHFDGDDYGTGTWTTDEYELAITFVASGATETIETLGLPCAIAVTTPPPCCCCCCCCCTPPTHDWPNSLGLTRFNRVDFTP